MPSQLSKEEIEKQMQEMKQQTKNAESKKKAKADSKADSKDKPKQDEVSEKDKEIAKLKKQLQSEKKRTLELSDKRDQEKQNKRNVEARNAMNSVLADGDNKFEKDYSIPVEGQDDYKFHVVMHAPSAFESGRIMTQIQSIANANSDEDGDVDISSLTPFVSDLYQAFAYFRVVGDQVPEAFKHPEQVYRWEVLLQVMHDYLEWNDTFLQSRKF